MAAIASEVIDLTASSGTYYFFSDISPLCVCVFFRCGRRRRPRRAFGSGLFLYLSVLMVNLCLHQHLMNALTQAALRPEKDPMLSLMFEIAGKIASDGQKSLTSQESLGLNAFLDAN